MRILTAQKMKFCITDFLRIWSYLLKKSVMGNFIFCMVSVKKVITWLFLETFHYRLV